MHSLIPLSLILTFLDALHVNAFNIPFHGHTVHTDLVRRANVSLPVTGTPVKNIANTLYVTNVTVGGVPVSVLLDTGSSDLWVNFPGVPPATQDLGKSVSLSYVVGKATGNVHSASVELGGHTVSDQAFLLVTDTSTFSTNIQTQGYTGLIGLGPNAGSNIAEKIDGSAGASFIDRLFAANSSLPQFTTLLLDRVGDPTPTVTGQLTIGETVAGLNNITTMPKLDVEMVHRVLDEDQHWQILADKDEGIIGPDGQVIQIDSIVPSAPDGQLVAVLDSGYTFSQVARSVTDAIYGRVNGAVFDSEKQWWTIPCGQPLNLTFKFGGTAYPVHPLDTVNDDFHLTDSTGKPVCIGAFQPITSAFSLLGEYDMILGMNFLRNAYTLLSYGKWIDGSSGDPYVQLLPLTSADTAYADFIAARLGGTAPGAQFALLPADQMQHSPVSAEEKKKQYQEMVLSRWPYIFLGCLAFVALVVGFCVWRCCCRRGKNGAPRRKWFGKKDKDHGLGPMDGNASSMYLTLEEQPGSGKRYEAAQGYGYGGRHTS